MNVSFTGVKVVKIGRSKFPEPINYSVEGVMKNATADAEGIQVKCELTNDGMLTGNPETDQFVRLQDAYHEAMEKVGYDLYLEGNKNTISIKHEKYYVTDKDLGAKLLFVNTKLNGYGINLADPKDRILLPIYSIIGNALKQIKETAKLSQEQMSVVNEMFEKINKNAVDFIEDIMPFE